MKSSRCRGRRAPPSLGSRRPFVRLGNETLENQTVQRPGPGDRDRPAAGQHPQLQSC